MPGRPSRQAPTEFGASRRTAAEVGQNPDKPRTGAVLPLTSDEQLRSELHLVVTAGWQLPSKTELRERLRYLMMLAEGPPTDTFEDRARRLLQLLDVALRPERSDLLTDDQSLGLRILLGTHPEYHDARAMTRRENAGVYLAEPRKGQRPLRPESLYKRRQQEWLQLAVDCLREAYGQDQFRPRWIKDQVLEVTHTFQVGPDGLLASALTEYTSRALQDEVTQIGRTIIKPPGCVDVLVEAEGGVDYNRTIDRPSNSTTVFNLAKPAKLGDYFRWSFRTAYRYEERLPLPADGYSVTWEHNSEYRLVVRGRFAESSQPPLIWWHASNLFDIPQRAYTAQHLRPDEDGWVEMKRVRANLSRYGYGIAWRWQALPGR